MIDVPKEHRCPLKDTYELWLNVHSCSQPPRQRRKWNRRPIMGARCFGGLEHGGERGGICGFGGTRTGW
jgi:hypothetical protein